MLTGRRSITAGGSNISISNNYALDVDRAVFDYANIPDLAVYDQATILSASCWYKNNVANPAGQIHVAFARYKSADICWLIGTFGNLLFVAISTNGSTATSHFGPSFTLTNWNHLGFAFNSGSLKIYLNGESVSFSGTPVSTIWTGASFMNIGAADGPAKLHFLDGQVDECALWNAQLTNNDMKRIYNGGNPPDLLNEHSYETDLTSNLIGWWRCGDNNGGIGTTINDLSSYANHATLAATATFTTDAPRT